MATKTCGLRARPVVALLLVLASTACASKWMPRTSPAPIPLQWPFAPHQAKLTFVASLTGFGQESSSSKAFKAFVYGKDRGQRDAFVLPVSVATGSDGRIAVADMGRRCVHLYVPGQRRYLRLTGAKTDKLAAPVAVIFDDELRLYVSDSSGKVLGFDKDGDVVLTLNRAGVDPLLRPTGLAYSPIRKRLYVVDTLANRIHAFKPHGELDFSFGQRGDGESLFNYPTNICWSPRGELYVTNSLAFRVEIFDEDGKPLGSFGRHGDGSGDLAMPKGIAVDKDGVVYVVDSLFDNVQLFNRRGDFLLTLGARGVDFGEFWLPSGAFISGDGELYVCDTYNRRIQVFRITERYAASAL